MRHRERKHAAARLSPPTLSPCCSWRSIRTDPTRRAPPKRLLEANTITTDNQGATEGGRIVLPYSGPHHPSGLAVLTVKGGTATGQIINDQAWFMPMKGQGISQDQLRQPHKPHVRIEVRPDGQDVTTQP